MAGERGLTADRLDQVAQLLGLTVSALFDDTVTGLLLSPDALEVARRYDASTDPKARQVVRVALDLPAARKEPPATRASRTTTHRRVGGALHHR